MGIAEKPALNENRSALTMLFGALLDIFFPPLCHVCKSFVPDSGPIRLCTACSEKIVSVNSPKCTVCGIPFKTENGIDHICGACATTSRPFVSAMAAVRFGGPAQELIHRLKYGKKVQLSRPLGLMMVRNLAGFLDETCVEMIVPVPLHLKRLRDRGFNQAILLADSLSGHLRIPISRNNLRRIRWTEPQINLSPEERVRNVRGAFSVNRPELYENKKLLLVDDVYTTGSTVSECAKVLKCAGAGEIHVATAARAVCD